MFSKPIPLCLSSTAYPERRTLTSSPVPIDVVSTKQLQSTGKPGLMEALSAVIPSLTLPEKTGWDASAIDHVEVLRDGAAAQYGSDAIAGVINVVLKADTSGTSVTNIGHGRVYFAGDGLDFAGLQAGYTQFFGTPEQPNKPARTALQVVALPLPGALVEVEAIAARTL
ncbi:hypothetical protein cym2001_40400 [Pseudomonas sp. CYM-20-01]|uniref:Rid family hydrolase n=1 Tax=Pseudomonas sp. CYM-20-01 TaxID=2870750 RepID=UPI002059CBF7|nr:Rid family hydrolase [Pseudomonas sp. CYM-20-01]BDB20675.1 hypothetical protein cym2001_40400 [Pseudomonas sp. CYM-20-01]